MVKVKSSRLSLSVGIDKNIYSYSYGQICTNEKYNEKQLAKVRKKRALHPIKGGLFCENIFGPVLSYVCRCNKDMFVSNIVEGTKCNKCGVEFISNYSRKSRFAHIELPIPYLNPVTYKISGKLLGVSNINLYKTWLSKGSYSTGIYLRIIENDSGNLISKDGVTYSVAVEKLPDDDYTRMERVELLNKNICTVFDLYRDLIHNLKVELVDVKSTLGQKYGNKITTIFNLFNFIVPVTPPFYRDIKILDNGSCTYGEENIVYEQLINSSDIIKYGEHEVLDECNTLNSNKFYHIQFLINTLMLGGQVTKRGESSVTVIKSPIERISKKRGLIRGNMVGKRVDFSGRSFIVIDPLLDIDTVGLPFKMFYELIKPVIIGEIQRRYGIRNLKDAFKLYDSKDKTAIDIAYEIVKDKIVLMNRAPSLHRYSIMAFKVVLHSGKCIKLPNLTLTPFNADCILEDQKIHTAEYGSISIPELIDMGVSSFSVFSVNSKGKRVVGAGHSPRYIKTVNSYVEITWDNGCITKCTEDHKFLLDDYKSGLKYVKACDLKIESSGVYSSYHNNGKPVYPIDIKKVDRRVDVFDITVEDHHNYALTSGVMCHNCDGDTMAVHLVLTDLAKKEAIDLMSPVNNLLSSADYNKPNVLPSHEGIAGAYLLTTLDRLNDK